ncbi:MAG: ChaN family lipoprotein [Desulfobacterota bacterium]|nr:ChaN family lipoprotein [Thermodesulfobacteriota bacterium]
MPWLMRKGVLYELEDAFDMLMDYRVIFFGEEHGSRMSHEAEFSLLKGLAKRDPKIVLALEMFERDVQEVLDAYLKGEISEKSFLRRSRPWPNYKEDYRPLIELAKRKRIPVIAANVPRRAAAAVSRADKISPHVLGKDKIYLPKSIHLQSKQYYQRFASSIEEMPHFTPMKGMKLDGLYKAQVLKDAVMASSLEPFLDRRVFFCCGHFHVDYHLGIPFQLRKNHPRLPMAVVVPASTVAHLPMRDRGRIADFIWVED